MKGHDEIRTRQVTGNCSMGEGEVPPTETTKSTDATFSGEISRGIKFDDVLTGVEQETPMPEAHSSSDN